MAFLRARAAGIVVLAMACGGAGLDPAYAGQAGSPGSGATGASVVAPALPCPEPAAAPSLFNVPQFALAAGAFADWIGDDIVVAKVGPTRHGERLRNDQTPDFHGAIWEAAAGRWSDIPPPPGAFPPGPGINHYARVVGGKLVWLTYGQTVYRQAITRGLVYDPATRRWTEIPQSDAPAPDAYLTGPYRQVTVGDRWVWWPQTQPEGAPGFILDAQRARWLRASAQGAPDARRYSTPMYMPDGRVIVAPVTTDAAGAFDPAANRWEPFSLPRGEPDFEGFAISADGASVAALAWSDLSPAGTRSLSAWLVDTSSFTATTLPSPRATFDRNPNARYVHWDGERLLHVDREHLHEYRRSSGEWTAKTLPFESPVSSGGSLREVCGRRLLLVHDTYWLLDLDTTSWHRVAWPEGAPQVGRHILYGADRIVILGDVHVEVEQSNCPRGAPCMAPARRRVEDTRAWVIPLR